MSKETARMMGALEQTIRVVPDRGGYSCCAEGMVKSMAHAATLSEVLTWLNCVLIDVEWGAFNKVCKEKDEAQWKQQRQAQRL
jgi:hypothetical protein